MPALLPNRFFEYISSSSIALLVSTSDQTWKLFKVLYIFGNGQSSHGDMWGEFWDFIKEHIDSTISCHSFYKILDMKGAPLYIHSFPYCVWSNIHEWIMILLKPYMGFLQIWTKSSNTASTTFILDPTCRAFSGPSEPEYLHCDDSATIWTSHQNFANCVNMFQ